MVLPIPLLAWAAARRFGLDDRVAVTAALVPLTVPQFFHIGAAINNDNLLVLLSAVIAVLVAGVLEGNAAQDARARDRGHCGARALTKAFALALLPWIALAYGLQVLRKRDRWVDSAVALVIAGVTASLIGAWWYIDNLARHGKISPSVLDPSFTKSPPRFHTDPIWYLRHFRVNRHPEVLGQLRLLRSTVAPGVRHRSHGGDRRRSRPPRSRALPSPYRAAVLHPSRARSSRRLLRCSCSS